PDLDGKAVESTLRGFRAGLAAARNPLSYPAPHSPSQTGVNALSLGEGKVGEPRSGKRSARPTLAALEAEAAALAVVAREIATEGVRRLVAYQDAHYARLYLARLKPVA